jgi:RNA polymerase sigma-70 factor, ECF subfamily
MFNSGGMPMNVSSRAGKILEEIGGEPRPTQATVIGMTPVVTDRELVGACQRGDRDAFRALFEAYRNKVYSIALRFSGDQAAAMDIAQETFIKLFSSIRDFRGDASFDTWIYRLVVNASVDHRRRGWRLLPLLDDFAETLRAPAVNSLDDLLRDERGERVRAAIDRLAAELRIVVVLRYTEGLSYDEIAEVLGCAVGTVASRLNRAHKKLERWLAHV